MTTDLAGLELKELETFVQSLGHKKFHAKQIYQWIWKRGVSDFNEMTNLSRELRASLAASATVSLPAALPPRVCINCTNFCRFMSTPLSIAARMSETIGQSVLVENRTGANGIIGMEAIARAAPDGYTVGMGNVATLAINPYLYAKLPYDPLKDFAPVLLAAEINNCLAVHPSVPVTNVKELIAFAKARPGQLNYASGGVGNMTGKWDYISVGPDPWGPGGKVEPGTVIKIDVGCVLSGYSSDSARTFVFGRADAHARAIHAALRDAFGASSSIPMMKSAITTKSKPKACTKTIPFLIS